MKQSVAEYQIEEHTGMEVHKLSNLSPVEGHGSWLADGSGDRYLDFTASDAASLLGHGGPEVVGASGEGAEGLTHRSGMSEVPLRAGVAGMLADATGFDRLLVPGDAADAEAVLAAVVGDASLLDEARFKGRVLRGALERIAERIPGAEVRGEGLLLDLDLGDPGLAKAVTAACLERRVLVGPARGADTSVVRLAPPLTVTRDEIRQLLDALRVAIAGLTGGSPASGLPAVA